MQQVTVPEMVLHKNLYFHVINLVGTVVKKFSSTRQYVANPSVQGDVFLHQLFTMCNISRTLSLCVINHETQRYLGGKNNKLPIPQSKSCTSTPLSDVICILFLSGPMMITMRHRSQEAPVVRSPGLLKFSH